MKPSTPPYKKILACIDLSANSQVILLRAVELADFYKAELVILHVNESLPALSEPFAEPPALIIDPELSETLDQRLQKELDELVKQAAISNLVPVEVLDGAPRHIILEYAKKHHIDLLVIGHHRDGILDILGSTANALVNKARCDVIVITA